MQSQNQSVRHKVSILQQQSGSSIFEILGRLPRNCLRGNILGLNNDDITIAALSKDKSTGGHRRFRGCKYWTAR